MPISKYYGGHGEEVMSKMKKKYGSKKGKQVFYATANKRGKRPHNREDDGVFGGKDLKDGYRKILVPKRWDTETA